MRARAERERERERETRLSRDALKLARALLAQSWLFRKPIAFHELAMAGAPLPQRDAATGALAAVVGGEGMPIGGAPRPAETLCFDILGRRRLAWVVWAEAGDPAAWARRRPDDDPWKPLYEGICIVPNANTEREFVSTPHN